MLRDKAGNRLFRKVQIKIIFPDDIFPPKILTQRAGPHQGFGPDGIDGILMNIADQLENLHPYWDFKSQELAPEGRTARYVITFAGYRTTQVPQHNPDEESKSLIPEPVVSLPPTRIVGNSLEVPPTQE